VRVLGTDAHHLKRNDVIFKTFLSVIIIALIVTL